MAKLITKQQIDRYCKYYKYKDCRLIHSLIKVESSYASHGFNPEDTGSYGLMQIQCATAKGKGLKDPLKYSCEQLFNPQINLRFGIQYLNYLHDQNYTSVEDIVAAWNAGYVYICNRIHYDKKKKRIKCYPGEYINQDYVTKVMRHYKYLKRINYGSTISDFNISKLHYVAPYYQIRGVGRQYVDRRNSVLFDNCINVHVPGLCITAF